jgi:hypothetical protein
MFHGNDFCVPNATFRGDFWRHTQFCGKACVPIKAVVRKRFCRVLCWLCRCFDEIVCIELWDGWNLPLYLTEERRETARNWYCAKLPLTIGQLTHVRDLIPLTLHKDIGWQSHYHAGEHNPKIEKNCIDRTSKDRNQCWIDSVPHSAFPFPSRLQPSTRFLDKKWNATKRRRREWCDASSVWQ